jgi:hypothetical protein
MDLLKPLIASWRPRHVADHSFKVSAKRGRAASYAEAETLDGLTG